MQMTIYQRALQCIFTLTAIFTASALTADNWYQETMISQDSCCHMDCCNPPPQCGLAYNPPAYFECHDCCGCYDFLDTLRLRSDFLWWRPCVSCLELGVAEMSTSFPDDSIVQESRIKDPDFHFDPGFRIGLSSYCPCDCFDAALNWTHFHSHANALGTSSPVNTARRVILDPTATLEFINDWQTGSFTPDFVQGKWHLELDVLDLEFGRKFYVSKCFVLRPNFGLRGARINQTYKIYAQSNVAGSRLGGTAFKNFVKARSNFLGLGPRLGLDIELTLPCTCGIKLFGQAAESLVFGRTERHSHELQHSIAGGEQFPIVDSETEIESTLNRCSRSMTDLLIGLKWEHCCSWCNRPMPITIAIAWEFHKFHDLNNFIFTNNSDILKSSMASRFNETLPNSIEKKGDLSTQGVTASFEVGF